MGTECYIIVKSKVNSYNKNIKYHRINSRCGDPEHMGSMLVDLINNKKNQISIGDIIQLVIQEDCVYILSENDRTLRISEIDNLDYEEQYVSYYYILDLVDKTFQIKAKGHCWNPKYPLSKIPTNWLETFEQKNYEYDEDGCVDLKEPSKQNEHEQKKKRKRTQKKNKIQKLRYVIYNKIKSLYKKEKGCVSKRNPGSLVIAKRYNYWIVSFGWNYRDSVIIENDEALLKEVVNTFLKSGYVFYNNEDMLTYVYDKQYWDIEDLGKVLKPEQAAKVLGWSNEKFKMEMMRAQE